MPFRSEAELVKEGETAEQAFSRASSTNSGIHLHHEKLEQMLKAQENVKNINNARQQQGNDTTDDNKSPDVDPCVVGEAKSALDDLQDLQQKPEDKISLSDRIAMINADQSRVFCRVSDHFHHQHKHETDTCKCTELSAMRMFLTTHDLELTRFEKFNMCCCSNQWARCIQCRWCDPPLSLPTSQ